MKNKRTSNKSNSKREKVNRNQDYDRGLDDFGLEPPRIYRETQKMKADTQRKIADTHSQRKAQRQDGKNLTRGEKRAKETKRRKKRNKLRKILIWFTAVIAFIALGVVLSLTVFFHINTIEITGNKLYPKEEISKQCTIDIGENLFMSDTDKARKTIEQNLPYVYDAVITRRLPDKIQISIKEAKPAYSIKCKDKTYILLDDRFKVLEMGAQASSGIIIQKAQVKSSVPGKTIEFKNKDVSDCLTQLAQVVKDNKFDEITAIYSNNIGDNYAVYDGRIVFKLGNCDNLEKKIYKGLAACEQLNSSNPIAKGTMTITSDKTLYFTEE